MIDQTSRRATTTFWSHGQQLGRALSWVLICSPAKMGPKNIGYMVWPHRPQISSQWTEIPVEVSIIWVNHLCREPASRSLLLKCAWLPKNSMMLFGFWSFQHLFSFPCLETLSDMSIRRSTAPLFFKTSHLEAHPVVRQAGSQDLWSAYHALAPGCASAGGTGECTEQ